MLNCGDFPQVEDTVTFFSDRRSPAPPTIIPSASHRDFTSPLIVEAQGTLLEVLPKPDRTSIAASKTFGLHQVDLIEALLGEGAMHLAENDQRLASLSAQSDRLEDAVRELRAQLGQTD